VAQSEQRIKGKRPGSPKQNTQAEQGHQGDIGEKGLPMTNYFESGKKRPVFNEIELQFPVILERFREEVKKSKNITALDDLPKYTKRLNLVPSRKSFKTTGQIADTGGSVN